jgi:hypothetical protein
MRIASRLSQDRHPIFDGQERVVDVNYLANACSSVEQDPLK